MFPFLKNDILIHFGGVSCFKRYKLSVFSAITLNWQYLLFYLVGSYFKSKLFKMLKKKYIYFMIIDDITIPVA